MPPKNDMPDNTWPITKDDKVEIQALGRELQSFLQGYFKDRDQVHLKLVVGAFNYIMDLQTQKTKLIGDDFILADKAVKAAKLEEKIEEPFTVPPDVPEPTRADRIAHLKAEVEKLEAEEEIENASPTPTEGAQPMAVPSADEGPSNAPVAVDPAPVAEAPVDTAPVEEVPAAPAA